MIVPDLNLLVYAYNLDAPHHHAARAWWEELLNGQVRVGLPWAVSLGFVRLMTHRTVLARPMAATEAVQRVRDWLARPQVEILDPGPRHLTILEGLLRAAGAAGSLTTDAHLAALAIEHQAELHSNDADFRRFAGLRWFDPIRAE